MFCRRRRHLNGGNGKDVVRAIADGIRHVREMARHVKRFDTQAHKYSSKVVGSIADSAGGGGDMQEGSGHHGGDSRQWKCKSIL